MRIRVNYFLCERPTDITANLVPVMDAPLFHREFPSNAFHPPARYSFLSVKDKEGNIAVFKVVSVVDKVYLDGDPDRMNPFLSEYEVYEKPRLWDVYIVQVNDHEILS